MTETVELVRFLEDVLKRTYAPIAIEDLRFERKRLKRLHTPEAKEDFEYLATNPKMGRPTNKGAAKILADYNGFVKSEEESFRQKLNEYVNGMREFKGFMLTYRNVLNYIAALAEGGEDGIETPSDEVVFDTLRRLNGNLIMGELGAGPETMEATMYLYHVVREAAYKHARRIGENPRAYFSRLTSNQEDRVITL